MISKEKLYKNIQLYILIIYLLSPDISIPIKIPYILWFISALYIILNIKKILIRSNDKILNIIQINIYALCILMLVMSYNNYEIRNIVHVVKLFIMFYIFIPIFKNNEYEVEEIYKALKFVLILNTIMILCGNILNISYLSSEMALGRVGTALSMPGSLYKVGVIVLPYAIYDIFNKLNLKSISIVICSILVIITDGSRTGFIVSLILTVITLSNIITTLLVKSNKVDWIKLNIFIVFGILLFLIIFNFGINESSIYVRIEHMVDLFKVGGIELVFNQGDAVRGSMITEGFNIINQNNGLFGLGFLTSKVLDMPIHNAYIQMFADLGILGLIIVLIIYNLYIVNYVFNIGYFIRNEVIIQKYFIGSFCGLICFSIYGLFHPFSVEIGDWSIFIISYVILNKSIRDNIGENKVKYEYKQ